MHNKKNMIECVCGFGWHDWKSTQKRRNWWSVWLCHYTVILCWIQRK